MGRQILSWSDVDELMEHLMPQFYGAFDAVLMIGRGGLIPGGLIAERLRMTCLLTTAVSFPADSPSDLRSLLLDRPGKPVTGAALQEAFSLRSMPAFHHFPTEDDLLGRRILVVHHVWNHGRAINAVAGRVVAAGGRPESAVLHYKPAQSIFPQLKPDYYAAVTDDFVIYPWEAAHRLEPYRPMPVI
jgi:hypothetical protein